MRAVRTALVVVVAATVGLAAGQRLERINPPGVSTPQTYAHIVKAGTLLFIAGQVGATADGKLAGSTMKEQTEQVLKNLETVLTSQGLDFAHVAKINIYTTSIAEFRARRRWPTFAAATLVSIDRPARWCRFNSWRVPTTRSR